MILKSRTAELLEFHCLKIINIERDAFDFVQKSRHAVVTTDISTCLLVTFATRTVRQKQKLAHGEKHCIRISDVRAVARVKVKTHRVSMRSFILRDWLQN